MFRKSTFHAFLMFLISLALPSILFAGWIQRDADGTKTFISDGKIKVVEGESPDTWIVLDYKNDQVTMVNSAKNIYASDKIDAYCQLMNAIMQAFNEMGAAFDNDESDDIGDVKVVVDGTDTVAGLPAKKHKVLVDGELYEEIWITTAPDVLKELGDTSRHEKLMECMTEPGDPVETSPAYRKMILKGWELRNISYDYGEKEYMVNVVEFKKAEIPDSEFIAPRSYKRIGFEEFFESAM